MLSDGETYDHLDYSRPIQPPIPHYHRTKSNSTFSSGLESNHNERFNFPESTYDAPIPFPKQLNINVPPLPMKNQMPETSLNSQSSNSSQDENIDTMITVDKTTNKEVLQSNLDKPN
jgi:hypothetical protein